MPDHPGFIVRSYPAFRPARLHRVFTAPDALYIIRLKGLISASDAGHDSPFQTSRQAAISAGIRKLAQSSLASALDEVEGVDPEEMVRASKKNLKIPIAECLSSSLDPPPLFGGAFARWKVVAKSHANTYQIEDAESLAAALVHLQAVLGDKLTVNVKPPE